MLGAFAGNRALSLGDGGLPIEPLDRLFSSSLPLIDGEPQDFFKRLPSCGNLPDVGQEDLAGGGGDASVSQPSGTATDTDASDAMPPNGSHMARAVSLEYFRAFLGGQSDPMTPNAAHQSGAPGSEQNSGALPAWAPTQPHLVNVSAAQPNGGSHPSLLPPMTPRYGRTGASSQALITTPPPLVPTTRIISGATDGATAPSPTAPMARSPRADARATSPRTAHTSTSGQTTRGVVIQNPDGLTKQELRRMRRMISNRESARRSRKRKQEHLGELEEQLRMVQAQLADANARAARLAEELGTRDQQVMGLSHELEGCRHMLMMSAPGGHGC